MKENQTKRVDNSARLVSSQIKGRSCVNYSILHEGSGIACHLCGHISHERRNVEMRFCPGCMTFHEDFVLMQRLNEGLRAPLDTSAADWSRLREAA